MLQRLFRTKGASRDSEDIYTHSLLESEPWSPLPLKEGHIRILFCQDAGESNKTVLYDSELSAAMAQEAMRTPTEMAHSWNGSQRQALGRVSLDMDSLLGKNRDFRPHSLRTTPSLSMHENTSQQQRQTNRRLDLIGDMIFGTAPLAYKGMNTKVHYKRDKDPQIVLSKLFTLHPRDSDNGRRISFSSINSDRSATSSLGIYGEEAKRSVPGSVQSVSIEDTTSEQSSDDESRYSASIYPPILGLHTSSRRSFHSKRSQRFSQTTLENGIFRPTPLPSSRNVVPVRHTSRSVKYALAIVITLEDKNKTLHDFVFSHFALIENRMHQLQTEALNVLCDHFRASSALRASSPQQIKKKQSHPLSPNIFQHEPMLVQGVVKFKQAFYDLYGTPRIQEPLWLNMSTFPQRRSDYSKTLIKELVYLIHEFDNPTHHYLVSTMITAVLTYHLSWVHTVAPPERETALDCHYGNYDPLWAQLSDMYGYVGTPSRIARTIVIGQKASVVRRILYVLSYLIRCNEVYENFETLLDPQATNLFGNDRGEDASSLKLEDKIVRQLIGSSTDLESIDIPKTQRYENEQTFSESLESVHSAATIHLPPFPPTPWQHRQTWTPQEDPTSSHSSLYSSCPKSPSQLSRFSDKPTLSPSGVSTVDMPRSLIFHMEPDITQIKDSGIPTDSADRLYAKSYGRSLMASYCDGYKSDFVLMGMPNNLSNAQLERDMQKTLQQFAMSDAMTESSCLVIDTTTFRCRVLNQHVSELSHIKSGGWQNVNRSPLVSDLLAQIKHKNDTGLSPEDLVEVFEDGLQLLYLRSTLLQERVYECLETATLSPLEDPRLLAVDLG
ncbi:folliculin-interacting protein middle domain-containing protein [Spinellus fusiger]|nr:folliculin-interacting protein middle domain-containing protein [Spinellus fusiger]